MEMPITERQLIEDKFDLMKQCVDWVDKNYPNKSDEARMSCSDTLFINLCTAVYYHRKEQV